MPTIVVEGPDESGKTTYANALADRLGVEVVHSPVKQTGWLSEYSEWTYRHSVKQRLTVLDRAPEISELVYGTVLRGHSRVNPWESLFDWHNMPMFVVMMIPSESQYSPEDHHYAAGSRLIGDAQHQRIYGAYVSLAPWLQKGSRSHLFRTATVDRYMGITYSMCDAAIESWLLNFPTAVAQIPQQKEIGQ